MSRRPSGPIGEVQVEEEYLLGSPRGQYGWTWNHWDDGPPGQWERLRTLNEVWTRCDGYALHRTRGIQFL